MKAWDPDASPASFALRWVADHQNVKVILSGMSTEEQVRENLQTFSPYKPLSEHERAVLEEIGSSMRSRIGNDCTGCKYCMPCPFGVDIPGNFALWNKYRMFNNYEVIKDQWRVRAVLTSVRLPVRSVVSVSHSARSISIYLPI